MVIKKLLIDTTTTGVITTLQANYTGPTLVVSWTLVTGFQGTNNADFSINATTGEVSVPIALGVGRYYFRFRATQGDNPYLFEEGTAIVDVATEIVPTISGDLDYGIGGIAPGDVVATVTSALDDPFYSMIFIPSTGSNPALGNTESDFEIDSTTGEVSWTGDGDSNNAYDYAYQAVVTATGTSGCFSETLDFEILPVTLTACEAAIAAMPSSFNVTFNADSPGDNLGSDAFENFTANQDAVPKGGADVSYSWDDEPYPSDSCGSSSCFQLRFRLYGFCTGAASFTWTVSRPARACEYVSSIPVIPSVTSDPTGDYTFDVIDGDGGGGAGPCSSPPVDNITTGQQGTLTIS